MDAPEAPSFPSTAIYALTPQGLDLAFRLADRTGGQIYAVASLRREPPARFSSSAPRWFASLSEQTRSVFPLYSCHIFIAAAGIAVRAIAPLLKGKAVDPAVLVLDQRGRHVISLLSGHLGGANAMARRVAALLGATPVITTATDCEGLPALDELAREKGLAVGNLEAVKRVSAALLAGEQVLLRDPENHLGLRGSEWEPLFLVERKGDGFDAQGAPPSAWAEVRVTACAPPADPDARQRCLYLHSRVIHAGIGCRKGTPAGAILEALADVCARRNLAMAALACLASIEAKRQEPGLNQAATALGLPLLFFSPAELAQYSVSSPSPKARELFGVEGVCEPAALAAASGKEGGAPVLLAGKQVFKGVTVALARPPVDGESPESLAGGKE